MAGHATFNRQSMKISKSVQKTVFLETTIIDDFRQSLAHGRHVEERLIFFFFTPASYPFPRQGEIM